VRKGEIISLIEQLVELIFARRRQTVSAVTQSVTRLNFLDALGCVLYGQTLADGREIINGLRRMEGFGPELSPSAAALGYGALCHLRELDDVHFSILHTGAVCVPVVLTTALREENSYGQMLQALREAVEVTVRIACSMDYYSHRYRGWHGTATCGAFGAAAGVAALLRLDPVQTVNALGIAGSRTGGSWAFGQDSAMSKRLHPGMAASDGLTAAYLAAAGVTGPHYILEAADGGLLAMMSDFADPRQLLADKDGWSIEEVEYKWYAACKSVHAPMEAAIRLAARGVEPDKIVSVRAEVNSASLEIAGRLYQLGNIMSAQLSIPYGVALGLLGGDGQVGDYSEAKINTPAIYSLAQKVEVVTTAEFDRLRKEEHKVGARIEVRYCDGTCLESRLIDPRGSHGQPLSPRDMQDKFIALSGAAIGREPARLLAERILGAEEDVGVRRLLSPLTEQIF